MFSYADSTTVQELPDVLSVSMLASALDFSVSHTHAFIEDMKIPYLRVNKRKVIFKEHLMERLKGKSRLCAIASLAVIKNLPRTFPPYYLKDVFGISNGLSYNLLNVVGFPVIQSRGRCVIDKLLLIEWIESGEVNK